MTFRPFKRTAREPGQPYSREEISRAEVTPPKAEPKIEPKAEPRDTRESQGAPFGAKPVKPEQKAETKTKEKPTPKLETKPVDKTKYTIGDKKVSKEVFDAFEKYVAAGGSKNNEAYAAWRSVADKYEEDMLHLKVGASRHNNDSKLGRDNNMRSFKRTAREPGQQYSREDLSRGEAKPEVKPTPKLEPKPEPKPEVKEKPVLLKPEDRSKEEKPVSLDKKSTTVKMGEAETRKFNETIYANINDSHKMITETLTSLVEAIDKELQVFEGLSVKADANIDDMQKAFDECRVQVGDVSETVDKAGKLAKKLAGLAMKSPSDLARPTIEKMLSEFAAADPEKWQAISDLGEKHDEIIVDFYNGMKFKFTKENVGKAQLTKFTKSYESMITTLRDRFEAIKAKAVKNVSDFERLLADMSDMMGLIDQLEKKRTELGSGKGKNKLSSEEVYNDPEFQALLNKIKNSPFASILPTDTLKYPELNQPTDLNFERLASRLVIAAMFRFAAEGGFNPDTISDYNEINAEIADASELYLSQSVVMMSAEVSPAEEYATEKAPAKAKPSWRERFMPTPEPTTAKKKHERK